MLLRRYRKGRLTQAIQALTAEGPAYRNCWVEPYTKTRNGKQYTYYQLRWLTGESRKSGEPKVKTKHLSHRAVGEVRRAIARGHQIECLERECRAVEEELSGLRQIVLGKSKQLQGICSQNFYREDGR